MRLLDILKSIDRYTDNVYTKIQCCFFGKVTVKLLSEILLACLIALAVYIANSAYHSSTAIAEDNKKLSQIYVSISTEYVDSLFGTPYITISENNGYTNNFYKLNKSILRTVAKDNNVIAFFITSTSKNSKIPVDSFETGNRTIGKTTYSDIEFTNPTVESNVTMNGRYIYYSEMQGTGRYGMYNYYLYGNVSYGFHDDYSIKLIEATEFGDEYTPQDIVEIRKKAKPNTFGVISSGYEEQISIIPMCDEWSSMHYLLDK